MYVSKLRFFLLLLLAATLVSAGIFLFGFYREKQKEKNLESKIFVNVEKPKEKEAREVDEEKTKNGKTVPTENIPASSLPAPEKVIKYTPEDISRQAKDLDSLRQNAEK